ESSHPPRTYKATVVAQRHVRTNSTTRDPLPATYEPKLIIEGSSTRKVRRPERGMSEEKQEEDLKNVVTMQAARL
ncbi:hypothetical protein PIB30_080614, partial [Stylosanthes scabra]|nr:hypothetical protein [Stylosanthes scabra]